MYVYLLSAFGCNSCPNNPTFYYTSPTEVSVHENSWSSHGRCGCSFPSRAPLIVVLIVKGGDPELLFFVIIIVIIICRAVPVLYGHLLDLNSFLQRGRGTAAAREVAMIITIIIIVIMP